MAIKPTTNTNAQTKSEINRAEQTSIRSEKGNARVVIKKSGGRDAGKNYSIGLKDIDTAIIGHMNNIMKPRVREANEIIKVPVIYGNEERWKSVRKRGVMRDKNGSLILPLIMLKRVSVEKSDAIPGYEHDIRRKYTEIVRNNGWSKHNRYSRFGVQTGNKAVHQNLVTTIPNFVNVNYEFILWTNFIEQMNPLVETFMEHNQTYWGNKDTYRFISTIDSVSDASEMDSRGERFIKSTFSVNTKAYLLPEETNSIVMGKMGQVQKRLTPSRVIFGYEGDATNEQVKK